MYENTLIKNAAHGDKDAFRALLKPYIKDAYQTAYLLLYDIDTTNIAVEEALIDAYNSLRKFDEGTILFKTWFNRIVINCVLSMSKRRYTEPDDDEYDSPKTSTEKPNKLEDKTLKLLKCMNSLKMKYRIAVVMYYFQQQSIAEIANTLDIREGTAKSRLKHGKRKLKAMLKRDNSFFER